MAGFVLDDPMLSKFALMAGGANKQRHLIANAKQHGCFPVPLLISETRINWLREHSIIEVTDDSNQAAIICKATMSEFGIQQELQGNAGPMRKAKAYRFMLKMTDTRINNIPYYAVYYGDHSQGQPAGRSPVLALVDSAYQRLKPKPIPKSKQKGSSGSAPVPLEYWLATTADYDLFAVWQRMPRARFIHELKKQQSSPSVLQAQADSQRPVSAMDARSGSNLDSEYEDCGNSKDLIRIKVRPALNKAFEEAGYTTGDLVHHSDEAGRPNIAEIDFPIVVFLPQKACGDNRMMRFINNTKEFVGLYVDVRNKFLVDLNQGWIEQLNQEANKGADSKKMKLAKEMSNRSIVGGQ
jgi:hypothetical protein